MLRRFEDPGFALRPGLLAGTIAKRIRSFGVPLFLCLADAQKTDHQQNMSSGQQPAAAHALQHLNFLTPASGTINADCLNWSPAP